MCSPREVVPGSQDPGSGVLHRLPVGCGYCPVLAHRILGDSSASISISCPSVWSELIAVAHVHLWSSFRWYSAFCGHTELESPLLTHPETMVSYLFIRSRLFP